MHHRPHWSYSAISQYLTCPLRFYFQRIQKLPLTSVGSSLVLGSSVHAALAEYHRTVQHDEPTNTAKLHQIITDTWMEREKNTRISFRDGKTQADLIGLSVSLLELYLKEPPPDHIIGIEQEIFAPLHNSQGEYLETPLLAVADLITEGNEELKVQEFKTSGRAYSEMGGAGGEWLEHAGVNDALFWGGRIGGLLGATLCPVYVGQKILRRERSISKTQPERKDSQPS